MNNERDAENPPTSFAGRHTVESVTRHTATATPSQKGNLPAPDSIHFTDGHSIERVHKSFEIHLETFPPIRDGYYDKCPICLTPGEGTKEDVPPKSIGGKVLTNTCKDCNSKLGSRVDSHLGMWMHDEVETWVTIEGVRGRRRAGRHAIRKRGEDVVLVPRRPLPPEVEAAMVAGREPTFDHELPDWSRVCVAIAKSTYLAASVALEGIAYSPSATILREDLMAARDLKPGEKATLRQPLRYLRGPGQDRDCATRLVRDPDDGQVWVSLAGVLLVEWPFPDMPPPLGHPSPGSDSQ